jgi:hypothetical protein
MLYSTSLLQLCEGCGDIYKLILAEKYSVRSYERNIGSREDHHIVYLRRKVIVNKNILLVL